MDLYEIAKLIPSKYRKKILKENHFYKAVLEFHDVNMQQLWFYWANFIEPDSPLYTYTISAGTINITNQCKQCLSNLYKKWEAIMPHLIKLQQEENLLKFL